MSHHREGSDLSSRLLVVQEHFVQGFGGIPECTLLLGRCLRRVDISVDVLSKEGFFASVGELDILPKPTDQRFEKAKPSISGYQGVLLTGSWNPTAVPYAIRARREGVPLSYAPKGNLSLIEFTRPRDFKKLVYLGLVEMIPLLLTNKLIFESSLERRRCIVPGSFIKKRSKVIPEPYDGLCSQNGPSREDFDEARPSVFGFMAEISPRKGLRELVEGFLLWSETKPSDRKATLLIAGEPRGGSDAYLRRIKEIVDSHPDGVKVVWCGARRGLERDLFYQELDFFICPSRFESFGLTPIEALWQGIPVVCSPTLGALEFLNVGEAMITLEDLSAQSVAKNLEVADANRRGAIHSARTAREKIAERLSQERLSKEFAECLVNPPTGGLSST